MKIHEYQAKALLKSYNIPVGTGHVVDRIENIKPIAEKILPQKITIKAQIHAGGRGKAGGVKITNSVQEAYDAAKSMFGKTFTTHQTGPNGLPCHEVLVEASVDIKKEYYVSITLDREKECPVLIASREGGVEIEEVASKTPEKIIKIWIHPLLGLQAYQAREMAFKLGFIGDNLKIASKLFLCLDKLFREKDCSVVEINPLILTTDDKIQALDAKINLEDNGLARHPDLAVFRDPSQENPLDVEASTHNLNYINLDGNIGCMVNGAGLAMATMDIIKLYGGMPANFLDVGGGASTEMVKAAVNIILKDKNVKGILINIFGGIMKCDIIANGIIEATKDIKINVPVVVRLEGTHVDQGRKLLKESGLAITSADSMADAAEKIVNLVKENEHISQ